jgi:hypothetical protein
MSRITIDNFSKDVNDKKFILYIGNLDIDKLNVKMTNQGILHTERLAEITTHMNHLCRNFIFIIHNELQVLPYNVTDFIYNGYAVYELCRKHGKYYYETNV